jgi:hypothetical protein
MELTIAMFWLFTLFNRPISHFRRFLDEYKKWEYSVVWAFTPWTGVWMLRYSVILDIILSRRKWGYSILLIFIPFVGIWMFRGLLLIRYAIWTRKEILRAKNK